MDRAVGLLSGWLLAGVPALAAQHRAEVTVATNSFGELSVAGTARVVHGWSARRHGFVAAGYARLGNEGLSRADLPELSLRLTWPRVELAAGLGSFGWGVGEARAVGDVVNQYDYAGELPERLGQLHAGVSLLGVWGRISGWVLPWFRPSPLGGELSRPWADMPVDRDRTRFERGAGRGRLDWAVRWDRQAGPIDLAAWHFDGTARDPRFIPDSASAAPLLIAHYEHATMTGVEAQWVTGRWIWRVDGALRRGTGSTAALVAGTELAVTSYLSATLELAYDGRAARATTSFENDVVASTRLLFQDGWVVLRGAVDWRSANILLALTASRRWSDRLTFIGALGSHLGDRQSEPGSARRRDERASLGAVWHF